VPHVQADRQLAVCFLLYMVKKLCDGLGMTLGDFFAAPVFDHLEQAIQ